MTDSSPGNTEQAVSVARRWSIPFSVASVSIEPLFTTLLLLAISPFMLPASIQLS